MGEGITATDIVSWTSVAGGIIAAITAAYIGLRKQSSAEEIEKRKARREDDAVDYQRSIHGYEVLTAGQAKTIERLEKELCESDDEMIKWRTDYAVTFEKLRESQERVEWYKAELAKARGG